MSRLDDDTVHNVQVGIIGSGSMGAGMTLLFAEKGARVACYDTSSEAVQTVLQQAKEDSVVDEAKVVGVTKLENLVSSFPRQNDKQAEPRILVLSLPHGSPADGILDQLVGLLDKGDVVVDCGNEWWEDTQRRQDRCKELGIHWIGSGVSGGYQAARHGPSMSPGGSKEAYAIVEPYLRQWAAKTPSGDPCVEYMGPGGAGHYVKMVHNGIEHAQLSILCEVRAVLHTVLGLSNDTIAQLFEGWYKSGPLRGNFLVGIGFKGLRFKQGDGIEDEDGIVEDIEDKVTQDVDRSEGTGTWSAREAMNRHVACPAIAAAHTLRIISADKYERLAVVQNLSIPQPQMSPVPGGRIGPDLSEMFRQATYGAFLGAFVQGLELIARASTEEKWGVSLAGCMRIWRAGCIIQSDAICELLLPILEKFGPSEPLNLLESSPKVASELASTYPSIKSVCVLGVQRDAVIPALSATLEWIKSVGGKKQTFKRWSWTVSDRYVDALHDDKILCPCHRVVTDD